MSALQRLWKRERKVETGPEAEEIQALSDQFRVTLKAAVSKVEEAGVSSETLQRIKKLLDKEKWRWKDAYEVEQQLVLLYDSETLRTELSRRVLEAGHVLYPDAAAWYGERVKEAKSEESQRALLLRLINDLQWRYTVNEAKLGYTKQITRRTGSIFILAVAIFIGFLFVLFVGDSWEWGAWWKHATRFLTFLLAAVSGFLGASFSMVSSLKTRLESSGLNQMKNASSKAILLSRVLVGTGAAMILYFFFESNFLQGEAFPDLDGAPGTEEGNAVVQRALLIVWCFVAGFSEKFVPGLLARTEAKAGDQAQTSPHGVAPSEAEPAPAAAEAPKTPVPADAASSDTRESEPEQTESPSGGA